MASSCNKNYLLSHVPATRENPRLDTQHDRITHGIMKGRLVHESIPLDALDGPVADLGCGTGVWLNSLSQQLAKPKRHGQLKFDFVGFDQNSSAFCDPDKLAPNVRLVEHNCIEPFEPEYIGKFGLVNMRGLAFAIPRAAFSILLRNAISLLRPNGFLQWLDTEPQLWKLLPEAESTNFSKALELVSKERIERSLVLYMPDFMIQEYIRSCMESAMTPTVEPSKRAHLSLIHFSLTPGGAARPEASHENHLNSCFSDTVLETLQLLLQGISCRVQKKAGRVETVSKSEIMELERLQNYIANVRKSGNPIVCGLFPLLVAQNTT